MHRWLPFPVSAADGSPPSRRPIGGSAGAARGSRSLMATRVIHKASWRSRDEARELLGLLLAAEVVSPSRELWVVSPWISNVAVLDNRAADFSGLEPAWPRTWIRLQ